MSVNISFRCPDNLYSLLLEYKADEDKNISAALIRLIESSLSATENNSLTELNNSTGYITEAKLIDILNPLAERLEELEKYKLPSNAYDAAIDFDKYYYDLFETLKPFLESLAQADMEILDGWLKRLQDPKNNTMIGITPEVLGKIS